MFFSTTNDSKFLEYKSLFRSYNIRIRKHSIEIPEIQSDDVDKIARAKAKFAFSRLGRPLFVDHTSLHIDCIGLLPAGFTQVFVDKVGEIAICDLFGAPGKNAAIGRTTIAYCNGKTIHLFKGELLGHIPSAPSGGQDQWSRFGWNRIFVPEGYSKTFSELGPRIKNKISMRRIAVQEMISYVRSASL